MSGQRRYLGVTKAVFHELLASQNGRCAICKGSVQDQANVDHDHATNLVREVLGTSFITELLALVDKAPDESVCLSAERDRLQTEVTRLVNSIASGVPADTVAPLIREKEGDLRRLTDRLRRPVKPKLEIGRLRDALEQRAASWRADLRDEPQIARLVLRRLVGPLTLWDESERPDFIRWEATPKTELLDGLADVGRGLTEKGGSTRDVASPTGTGTSWTHETVRYVRAA
jgi:hypothetical protein